MKLKIEFKTPDVLSLVLDEQNLEQDEYENIKILASKYIKYDEYVTLELDTETGKMEVLCVQ